MVDDARSIDEKLDELLSDASPEVAAVVRELRAIVGRAFPERVEAVDFGNRLLAVGRSMKMRDLMIAIVPHTAHANLQLADGVDLPNPDGLIEGTGKRIRHIKVRSVEAARSPAVRAAVDAQVEARR